MPINYDEIMQLKSIGDEFRYTDRETMLYALGIGFGRDPMNLAELKFVYENDSRLQTIMAIVRDDPRAQAVLGRDIRIESVDSRTFAMGTGIGKTASYALRLAGSRGEGTLEVNLDLDHAQPKVTSMVLTGSDGHPYYLVGKEPENLLKQSI